MAQTIKGSVPVYLLPSDQHKEPIMTTKPDGSPLILKIRDVEINNVEKLKKMEGITVLRDFNELKKLLIEKSQEK